jgi:hypothetical protein
VAVVQRFRTRNFLWRKSAQFRAPSEIKWANLAPKTPGGVVQRNT